VSESDRLTFPGPCGEPVADFIPTPTYVPISVYLGSLIAADYSFLSRLVITGIALRSVKSSFHVLSVVAFYGFITLGLSSSALYKKLTPDL